MKVNQKKQSSSQCQQQQLGKPVQELTAMQMNSHNAVTRNGRMAAGGSASTNSKSGLTGVQQYHVAQGCAAGTTNQQNHQISNQNIRQDNLRGADPQNFSKSAHKNPGGQIVQQFHSPHLNKGVSKMAAEQSQSHKQFPGPTQVRNHQASHHQSNRGQLIGGLGELSQHHQSHQVLLQQQQLGGLNTNSKGQINAGIVEQILYPSSSKKAQSGKSGGGKAAASNTLAQQQRLAQAQLNYQSNPSQLMQFANVNQTAPNAKNKQHTGQQVQKIPSQIGTQPKAKSRNYLVQPLSGHPSTTVVARTQQIRGHGAGGAGFQQASMNKTGGNGQFQTQQQLLQGRSSSQQSTQSALALNLQNRPLQKNSRGKKLPNQQQAQQYEYDLTAYNDPAGADIETTVMKFSSTQISGSKKNGGSEHGSQNASLTRGAGERKDLDGSRNQGATLKNSKSLYTNISLREISQSPDRAADAASGLQKKKSKKILITSDKLTNQQAMMQRKQVQQIQSKRLGKNTSAGVIENMGQMAREQWQAHSQSQNQFQQFGGQHGAAGFQGTGPIFNGSGTHVIPKPEAATSDQEGAILNIKTVDGIKELTNINYTSQDINIYNNSFIVNTNGEALPQSIQAQAQMQVHQNPGQQIHQLMQQQPAAQQRAPSNKKGLKLRKDLSGMSSGFGQSRSASQGRGQMSGVSSASNQRATGPEVFHNQSYGAISADQPAKGARAYESYLQSSQERGSQVISHVMSHQNMANLQQNPNQKRVLSNPSGKLFGNLAAIAGMSKDGGGPVKKQRLQHLNPQLTRQAGAYQQSQKQGIKKILKNKLSSNTSRPQSRTESRGPILSQKGGDSDQNWGHLSSSNLQGKASHLGQGVRQDTHLETGPQHHQTQIQLLHTRDLGATAAEGRTEVNGSHPSNQRNDVAGCGLSNIHSNSQMVLSQLLESQKYTKMAPPANNKYTQASYSMAGQLKNLNSYEVRKQSLQDLRKANQPQNHKFRNQVLQASSDQERLTPNAETGLRQVGLGSSNGQINYSVSLKNDEYFQNRGGIMSRVNTEDAVVAPALDQPASSSRKRLEHLAFEALKDCEEAEVRLTQMLARLKRGLGERRDAPVLDSELRGTSCQLSALRDQIRALELQVSKARKDYAEIDGATQNFMRISSELRVLGDEATIVEALCMLDQGQTHEAIRELEKVSAEPQLEYIRSRSKDAKQPLQDGATAQKSLRIGLLAKAIVQKKVGDHEEALETLSSCIAQFSEFKDAYLVRGQTYLLRNKAQRALQDFIKFDSLASYQLGQLVVANQPHSQIYLASLELCIGKESLGDAYKKMKKYKLSDRSYRESLNELEKLTGSVGETALAQERAEHQRRKISMKIAMCAYYQGDMQQALERFQDIISYFKRFDQDDFRVQQVLMKCNFYCAKAMLALKESRSEDGDPGYQRALIHLQYCCSDEIDPELHELYSGNAFFEIAKVFLRQKDVLNAHDFIQRAADNNYNSKRLSLYRDFAEGVVQLMKRKIKRGVQILSDLLEVLLNGQRELSKLQDKKGYVDAADATTTQKNRYNATESESGLPSAACRSESMNEEQSTINGKANQVASGKFTKEMYDYLVFNIYTYRSYGYVAIEKYEHALEDLRKAKKISALSIDRATVYNKWLSRGILKMDTEEYLMASKYFGKASLRYPENKDSFCLNAISIVRSYSYSMASKFIDDQVKRDKVESTRRFLDGAIASCCKEEKQASLYFFRGLLNFQLHRFYEALRDFNVAISEEEEATGQFHLARGRCYACLSMLDEALNDLTVALELDDSLLEAYIFRGKCAYLHGDNNLAFHDFQKLIISDQKNPIVHIYAGNLLMTTGAYPDAIKAFDNADTVQQTALAAFQRIRCYCALSDLERAFEQMQLCMHLAPGEKLASFDYKVLLPLLSCVRSFDFSRGEDGQPDEAGLAEQRAILSNCVSQITSIIETFEKGEHLKLTKGQSPMSIQIIPNVNKIKLEKQFVQLAKAKRPDDDPILQELTAEEQSELDAVEPHGYYRENIFQLEEMYLYRSIFNTYLGNIDHAIADLNRSWKAHYRATQQAKLGGSKATAKDAGLGVTTDLTEELFGKFSTSQLVSPMSVASQQSQKSDLSDIGLCSLNVREYNYNMIINLVQARNWIAALKKINEELTQSPANAEQAKSIKQLYLLRAMVHQELGQTDKHNQDLTIYLKNFQSLQKNSQGAVVLEPFEAKGRLCQYFEPLKMNFSVPKTKAGFSIMMRPSFSMPFMKPPNMIPNIDEEAIQNEFNLKQIDAPMPEAPWTRDCEGQQFEPFNYLQEAQTRSDQERTKGPGLPYRYGKPQQFTLKYCGQDRQLIYDDKVAEDIDDLSDTEKVSLISDVELIKEEAHNEKPQQERIESNLGLKDMSKLNQDIIQQKKSKVSKIHNGVKIDKQKYLCGRRNSCSSCYRPLRNPEAQPLVELAERDNDSQIQNIKQKSQGKVKTDAFYDDTVSEEEYGSSSESRSQSAESKDKQKKKDGQSYSHSRFSSNIEGLEEELNQLGLISEMGCGIRDQNAPEDIDGTDIQIGQNKLKKDKSQLLGQDAKLLNREMLKEKVFNQRIGSIQEHADQLVDFQADADSPQKKVAPVKDGEVADSMVLMGSKNLDRTGPRKKSKKIGGTNLKKNKLAIAFNNLEMEQNQDQ